MDNQEEIIYCKKCGSPMKKTWRCCMKCGAINYAHPENQSMKKYEPKEKKETYTYVPMDASNNISTTTVSSNPNKMTSSEKKYRLKHVFFVLFILLLVTCAFLFFSPYLKEIWNKIVDLFMKIFTDFKETIRNSNS